MVGIAELGTGLLMRCILMVTGEKASFTLQRKGIVRVVGAQHLTYSSQHCCCWHKYESVDFCFGYL